MINLRSILNNKKTSIKLRNYQIEDGHLIKDYYTLIVAICLILEKYQKDLIKIQKVS